MSSSNLIVEIYQPNFLPWLGFFDKIAKADGFFILDDVQSPRNQGDWQNREKLISSQEACRLSGAINRSYSGLREVCELHFRSAIAWRQKMLRALEGSYKRHAFYKETMASIEPLVLHAKTNIAGYNPPSVTEIAKELCLDATKITLSSQYKINAFSNERLCELTLLSGGKAYMCGGGTGGYQDEAVFEPHRLKLLYQNFSHPTYSQLGQDQFVAGLSVIDAAMNLGWGGVRELLEVRR